MTGLQQTKELHLGRLEETRTEKKESYPAESVNLAYKWSRTLIDGWAVAQSPIMITTILQRLLKRANEPLLTDYEKISPQLNELLYKGRKVV